MSAMQGEGQDPRAREAAERWRSEFGREGHEGSYAQHDEAYRAYRERHLAELDRDYHEWCREHEQRFHRDFAEWRARPREVTNQPGDAQEVAADRAAEKLVTHGSGSGGPARRGR